MSEQSTEVTTKPEVDLELPDGITESEHQAIVSEVDSLMIGRGSAEDDEVGERARKSRRSGASLVIVVNILLVVVIAASVFGYLRFVPRSAPDVDLFTGTVSTAESAILSEFQEQTARALTAREEQIALVQQELSRLRSQRLAQGSVVGESSRELELQAALNELNATASERLTALQSSEEQIQFLSEQLVAVYERIQAALRDQRFDAARQLVNDAASLISSPAILAEPALAPAARAVAAANAVLSEVLPVAAEDSNQLAILASQIEEIDSIVLQANSRLESGDTESAEALYRTALAVIDSAEIASERLIEIEADRLATINAVEVSELNRQIGNLRTRLTQEATQAARAASELQDRIDSLEQTRLQLEQSVAALEGELARAESDLVLARESAASARADLAATGTESSERVSGLLAEVARLEESLSEREAELDRVRSEEANSRDALNQRLQQSVSTTRRAVTQLSSVAQSLQADFDAGSQTERASVLDLLSTRTLLRAVVDSPAIRQQYPSLADDVELYFQQFAANRVALGQEQAYAQASAAVETIADRLSIDLDTTQSGSSPAGYLDRVIDLTEGALVIAAP